MTSEAGGFFAQRRPLDGESPGGFLIRLADANALPKMGPMLKVIGDHAGITLKSPLELFRSAAALAVLERLDGLEAGSLSNWQISHARAYEGVYYGMNGQTWPSGALALENHQVCPACLRDEPYHRASWLFYYAPVCPVHQSVLLDACPSCGAAIYHTRRRVTHCHGCGTDLRRAEAKGVSKELAAFAAGLQQASVMPFGTSTYDEAISPDEVYALWSLAALPQPGETLSAKAVYRSQRVPMASRLEALAVLAQAWDGRRIDSGQLRRTLARRWDHLTAIPYNRLIESRFESICRAVHLDYETIPLAVRDEPGDYEYLTTKEFGKYPPSLMTSESAADFLNIPLDVFHHLKRDPNLVLERMEDEGFDGDRILRARNYLASMLTADEVDQAVGVPGVAEELERVRLLLPAKGLETLDRRYPASDLADLFDCLFESISPRDIPNTVQLTAGCTGEGLDDVVISRIVWILNGRLSPVAWSPPYRLIDLFFDPNDLLDNNSATELYQRRLCDESD